MINRRVNLLFYQVLLECPPSYCLSVKLFACATITVQQRSDSTSTWQYHARPPNAILICARLSWLSRAQYLSNTLAHPTHNPNAKKHQPNTHSTPHTNWNHHLSGINNFMIVDTWHSIIVRLNRNLYSKLSSPTQQRNDGKCSNNRYRL